MTGKRIVQLALLATTALLAIALVSGIGCSNIPETNDSTSDNTQEDTAQLTVEEAKGLVNDYLESNLDDAHRESLHAQYTSVAATDWRNGTWRVVYDSPPFGTWSVSVTTKEVKPVDAVAQRVALKYFK